MTPADAFETLSRHPCFGGVQGFYRHDSVQTGTSMRFAVYDPPQARSARVPVVFYLAGLTCTEETFAIKAGAQQHAARLGLMLVSCDTSPRGTGIAQADEAWDFGTAAGFYLDATEPLWRRHWRMASYVTRELRELVVEHFAARADRLGIFGHSMGGHGALTLALNHPGLYRSVSALAPIASPTQCPWGVKAFGGYLGPDRLAWARHDATELVRAGARVPALLIDQGLSDPFLASQLLPQRLQSACETAGQPLELRYHEGYDHGYYFVSTFMADHLAHHARYLTG